MLGKIKSRQRVLLFSTVPTVNDNIFMLLTSHEYVVDVVFDYAVVCEKLVHYKPAIFIADVDLIPEHPEELMNIFVKAKKRPVFLLINRDETSNKVQIYLNYCTDDVLTIPFHADKLYRKVRRAVIYNRMQNDIQYYSGMVFILKLIIPILLILMFTISHL